VFASSLRGHFELGLLNNVGTVDYGDSWRWTECNWLHEMNMSRLAGSQVDKGWICDNLDCHQLDWIEKLQRD
jgi:hypothetical protein